MKSKKDDFQFGNLSEVGRVRSENQDYFGRYDEQFGKLIIVCDGMGGYSGGEIASRLAVETIYSHFAKLGSHYDVRYEIEQAILLAHKSILDYAQENPEKQGMGTTVILMLIRENSYWFACVGDSRLYLRRNSKTRQLSKDHSFVQGMVDSGILTTEQAADHPKRNIITKALGAKDATPDVSGPFTIYRNDVFMMCTDGLYGYFSLNELNEIMAEEPQPACNKLVALANHRGGEDNITVQIIRSNIGDKPPETELELHKMPWSYVILACVLIIALAVAYAVNPLFKGKVNKLFKHKPKPQTEVIRNEPEEKPATKTTGIKKPTPPDSTDQEEGEKDDQKKGIEVLENNNKQTSGEAELQNPKAGRQPASDNTIKK